MSDIIKAEPTTQVRTEADRPRRATRVPFGVARTKLDVPMHIEGYHLHWINDSAGRVMEAQRGGYTFVEPKEVGAVDTGTQIKRLVGRDEGGEPLYAYLMKIELEYYLADQKLIQDENERFDNAIRRGEVAPTVGDHRYDGGIKIS